MEEATPLRGIPRGDAGPPSPLDLPFFARLAEAYRKEGLLDDAIHICREGLRSRPECVAARFVLGHILRDRGARQEAREEFRRILQRDPAAEGARRALESLEAEGNPQVDASTSRSASAGTPEERPDLLASPTLAALLAYQGDAAAAEGLYRQLGGTDPMSPGDPPEGGALLITLLAFRDAARRLRSMQRSEE